MTASAMEQPAKRLRNGARLSEGPEGTAAKPRPRAPEFEALEIVDRAIELGFLPAAPGERACTWCDFLPVCGPDEHARVAHKMRDKLGDLEALRDMP